MRFDTLPEWLHWQEELHFTKVDPGLERIGLVWQRLGGSAKLPFTVVTIAGTNGKGSSVAMLASILATAGYKVGTYTSPHLLRYNERICVDNIPCNDESICLAFDKIDTARAETSLTYFEFATLAAANIFSDQKVDIAILEVGMGGRLDATNLFDCNIALITPIALDHTAWLGTNREQIGLEKAGVICKNKPVVCSESSPPQSILDHAKKLQASVYQAEKEFKFSAEKNKWHWQGKINEHNNLALPALLGSYQLQNAAAVLQVVELLAANNNYTISDKHISSGLETVNLAGRFQLIPGDVEHIFDVTHNQQGAKNLAKILAEIPCKGRTLAVLAMLRDKDPLALVNELNTSIDHWYIAGLGGARGMSGPILSSTISEVSTSPVTLNEGIIKTYQQALTAAEKGDRILIFGSFLTVEAVMKFIETD